MIDFNYYQTLISPPLTPPPEVFPPVWGILYLLILASVIIYVRTFTIKDKIKGYIYYVTQMILNIAWVPVFFGLKNIGFAFIIVILLDIFIFKNIKEVYKTSKLAAFILIPYFLWCLYGTYLTTGFLVLN